MTCIVAVETPDGVWMGGDRLATDTHAGLCSIDPTPKITTVGPLLIGVSASYRVSQLITYALVIPPIPADFDPDRWVCELAEHVRGCLDDHGIPTEEGNGPSALFAIRGRVYELQDDYSVIRSAAGEYAIGSGRSVAYGALHVTRDWPDPESRIRAALEAAAANVATVGGPFDIIRQGTR